VPAEVQAAAAGVVPGGGTGAAGMVGLPRPGALLDLAVVALGDMQKDASRRMGLSETSVSHYGLGIRFPRSGSFASFVAQVSPYAAVLAPEGLAADEAAAAVEAALWRALCAQECVRALLDAEPVGAAVARCAARVLARLAGMSRGSFCSEDARMLFRALVFSQPALGREELRDLFARYLAWRVRHREGHWWDLFVLDPPRRVEVDGSSVPVLGAEGDAVFPAEPGKPRGVCPVRCAGVIVPGLKAGAALDVLMALADGLAVQVEYGGGCPAGRPALVARVECSVGSFRVASSACSCSR